MYRMHMCSRVLHVGYSDQFLTVTISGTRSGDIDRVIKLAKPATLLADCCQTGIYYAHK